MTGLPKTITVTSEETEEALKDTTSQIVEAVHSVLEKTPPELAADIADRGIVLTGGGSLLYGLEELIESKNRNYNYDSGRADDCRCHWNRKICRILKWKQRSGRLIRIFGGFVRMEECYVTRPVYRMDRDGQRAEKAGCYFQ